MLPFILTSVCLVYLIYYTVTRNLNYWKKCNVPGPEPVPLFGNIKESALRRKHPMEVLKKIYDQYPNEKVVGVYRMTTPCLFIRDPDIIKHVMIKDFDAFVDRGVEFDTEGLGKNLFHADGDTWQILRNKFTPLFTTSKLKNMLHLMTERGDKFIEFVDKTCFENSEQDVHSLIQKYTIATIAACAFGMDVAIEGDFMKELLRINKKLFKPNFGLELDMMFPGILNKLSASLISKEVKKFFYNLVNIVVNQRNGMPTNRKDFMDLILEMKQKKELQSMNRSNDEVINLEMTEGIMAAQAFIFYVAGFETSASTMTLMLYNLALNPDIQDKLLAEIDEELSKTKGEVTYDLLMEMKYMTKVFDETLRLYPLADPLQRNANRKYHIPGTDIVLNERQQILVSPYSIHRDPKYYPNPEKFDPERFSPENCGNRHPCVYLPFGVGPRNCIGMRFAKVQSRVCITKLLSKYRVEPSKNTPTKIEIDPSFAVLSHKGGIRLKFVPRNKT